MKHLDLKNQKVLLGLLSLIFVTGVVQTGAILKSQKANSQTAQVTSSPSCVSVVKHNYNQIFSNPFYVSSDLLASKDDYQYTVNLSIKNNCPRPISIIDPGTMSQPYSKSSLMKVINSFVLEKLDTINGPENIPMSPGNSYGIDYSMESGICVNCGSGSQFYRLSPLGTYPYTGGNAISVYNVGVGQTKTFDFNLMVGLPHSTEDFASGWFRAKLKSFKWTYTNSYQNDGLVAPNEIFTVSLTSAQQESFATDYVTLTQDGNLDENVCPDGLDMTLNDMNVPACL